MTTPTGSTPEEKVPPWAWAAALGGALVLLYFGHLLLPGRLLMVRDLPFLHLPLRETFAALVHGTTLGGGGWPEWNPTIHGGQPILSNPHYAAWYPATWLGLAMPVHWAIHLSVLAHAALAFAGAWRLLRQLGASRWGRAFAATAFAGGGFFVALTNTLLVFTGMAWTPWVLAGADAWLRRERRSIAGIALPLGLQILNGDPASVAVSLLLTVLLAWDAARCAGAGKRRGIVQRLALLLVLGLGVGAVQFLPTWMRLMESSRGTGLSFEEATVWSTRPARLVEFAFPTFYGEATRDEERLYFGWTLHDRRFPLLISIYPGLLALLLGIAGLAGRSTARRGVWLAAVLLGVFLGLGRNNPLFAAAHAALPFLSMVRYPEKFLLLSLTALVVCAALTFDRLVTARSDGDLGGRSTTRVTARLLAIAAAVAALGRVVWIWAAPGSVVEWMERSSGFALSPEARATGLAYLRPDSILGLIVTATALLVVLALCARRGPAIPAPIARLAVVFLAADSWTYSHRYNPTLPVDEFKAPELVASIPRAQRVFTDVAFYDGPAVGLPVGRRGFHQINARLDRLEPYSGAHWGISYALHEDYDLMLTAWGRHALGLLHSQWPDETRRARILDAWNVGTLVHVRHPAEMQRELQAARQAGATPRTPLPARLETNSSALFQARFAAAVELHPNLARAVEAARAGGFDAARVEHLVRAAAGSASRDPGAAPAAVLDSRRTTNRIEVRYRGGGAGDRDETATLIVAETFDEAWSAVNDQDESLEVLPTALGQIAIALPLPAGASRRGAVRLVYRDPWVRVGAGITLVTLLGLVLAASRRRADV